MTDLRLIVVGPGHFHAALLQQQRYPDVSPEARVYAPLGAPPDPGLTDYLGRIAHYNANEAAPSDWRLRVYAGADFLDRFRDEPPGGIAIFSGRNRGKIERIRIALDSGHHVLADKPVIIRNEDLPALEAAIGTAERRGLMFRDLMTGRCDPLAAILRDLVQDPEVFGDGQEVAIDSVHHIMKEVSGRPNRRPAWYFDIEEQGEGIADIGTHLVDRVHGTLFPDAALDHRHDIAVETASRWPTMLSLDRFSAVTGQTEWPGFLEPYLKDGSLEYFCNMRARYRVRGVPVTLETRWEWQAPAGGDDTHVALYRGSKARIELRQGAAQRYRPEIHVLPEGEIAGALAGRIAALQAQWPGVRLEPQERGWHIAIPARFRPGHDANFTAFARRFFDQVQGREPPQAGEAPNLVAKYAVCTGAVARARDDIGNSR